MNRLFLIGLFVIFASVTSISCKSIDGSVNRTEMGSKDKAVNRLEDNVAVSSSQGEDMMKKNKDDVNYRIIATSNYSNMPYAEGIYIARSFEDAVAISEGNNEGIDLFSTIDFKKEALLFVFAGQFNTGGYGISVDSIKREGKKKIIAKFSISSPAMGAIVTQAITNPAIIVALEVKKGEFISASFTE